MTTSEYEILGDEKLELEDYPSAIINYTKAIELYPKNDETYSKRGLIKLCMNNYKEAILDFTKSVELNPKNDDAYFKRGFTKLYMKDYKEAILDFTKSVELNPKNDDAYFFLGGAKWELKVYQGAIDDCANIREEGPVCRGYNDCKDNPRPFLTYEDKMNHELYSLFFVTCSELEKLDSKAKDYTNQVIRICDKFNRNAYRFFVYIHDILCDAFVMKKEYRRAIQELDNIIDEFIDDNPILWKYYSKKANLYIELGEVKKAIDSYKIAHHICDDNVDKIDINKKLQKLISEYNNKFVEFPYQQRKWIVVDDEKLTTTDAFVILDKSNLPLVINFPVGHPLKEELYIGHPFVNSVYMPYSNYEANLFRDKFEEFSYFIQCLGAKAMTIKVAKGSESNFLSNNTFSSNRNSEESGNISAGFKFIGGNVKGNESNSSDLNYNGNHAMREDAQTTYARTQRFNPTKKPYLPSDLIWLANEPSWGRLYQQRVTGNILHHHDVLSSKSSYSISEKEETSLKEAFKVFVSGDIGIGFFKANGEMSSESNSNIEELVEKTFSQSETIQWEIEIEFESIENLLETHTETEPTKTIAVVASKTVFVSLDEKEYIEEVKFMLEDDGIIDDKERSILERFRERKGITKEIAAELEKTILSFGNLNEDEKEYLDEYQEILKYGEITEKERRILNRMANRLGISEEKVKELES